MASVTIRPARDSDAETIAAFNSAMAAETERLNLDSARVLAGVRSLLADSAKGFYIVAEQDGSVSGQMMITFEWSDWRNGVFWWIQSVFVEPGSRRSGVFKSLFDHVQAMARSRPEVCGLRLYVERANLRARETYVNLGMSHAPYELYEVDYVLSRAPED